jgi:tetratricopeptide (TPR) repeat protein
VATKADKIREEAQKLAAKGLTDKAIKAYEQLVSMEPAVINNRQRLAELLVKAGRLDAARAEFEDIGKNFSSNGFYLKAIAIYTKLQGLFPGDIPITLNLADLNEKHGLTANALAEYKRVYDYYERTSDTGEALKILEKMQSVDPQNVNIRHKLAEAYFVAGKSDQSYAVFGKLATLLQERGDTAAFSKLNTRIQELFPNKSEFMMEVLAEQVAGGNAANAVAGLQALLRANPDDRRIWELIIEAYKQLEDSLRLKVAYQHYLKSFPDDIPAKTGLISCLASEKDLKGVLNLLDLYEQELMNGGCLKELESIYHTLDEIDPINLRVLEGLRNVCKAAGKDSEAASLDTKIKSLKNLSGKDGAPPPAEPGPAEEPEAVTEEESFSGQVSDEPEFGEVSFVHLETDASAVDEQAAPDDEVETSAVESAEEEFEIEVDIEGGAVVPTEEPPVAAPEADWLAEVGNMLDKIGTKAGKVKFGAGLDGSDAQSHYDLGMAFLEMGLYDESFKEFRQASADTDRRFECFVFQGVCLREKGDLANAEMILRALLNPELAAENMCAVKYELALTCEAGGKPEEYVALLTEIDKEDRTFRDVRSRLDSASGNKDAFDFSDDDFKIFDVK